MKAKRPPSKNAPLPKLQAPTVPADGVLPHDQWNKHLKLEVPNSAGTPAGSVIALTVNTVRYGEPHTVTYDESIDPGFKFPFTLPSNGFPSGDPQFNLALNYEVYDPETDKTTVAPYRYILIFDKEAPGAVPPNYLGFTQDQLERVYPEDLVDGYLVSNLSPWPKMQAGDTLTPWVSSAPADEGNAQSGLLKDASLTIDDDAIGRSIKVRFPVSALLALGDGLQYFGYQLEDRLGNTSAISLTRSIPVHLRGAAVSPHSASTVPPQPRVIRTRAKSANAPDPSLYPGKIEGLRPSDGRIKVAALTRPIDLIVPMPDSPIAGNMAQVTVNGAAIGPELVVPDTGTEFTLQIDPVDFGLADGYPNEAFLVDYRYYDPFSGDEHTSDQPVPLIIDRYAPGGKPPVPPPIAFTKEQLDGITEDDMDPVEDGLKVHIAAWFDNDYDDQLELWLGKGGLEGEGSYLSTLPPVVTDPSEDMYVLIPRADLEAVGVNPVYFGYRVTDWAGNVSRLSNVTPVNVFLTGNPGNLLAPRVPDAAPYNPEDGSGTPPGTGLLVWTEANPYATVEIPIYTNVAAGDRVTILWNGQTVPAVTVMQKDIDDEPTNTYLLNVQVPLKYVADGSPGPNIRISYRVDPSGGTPSATSPVQYINVNLATPGGPDPDPDPATPEHENMRPLRVLSVLPGSVPNVITPEAYTSNADITVYRAGVDNKVIWLVGDKLNIFWGPDHSDDPAEILITVANESSNIIVAIDAAFIKANGTGSIPVHYTLTRDLSNGNEVTVRSFDTTVLVQSPNEAPGGISPLAVANFPDSKNPITGNPNRFIQRATGLNGTSLRIPLQNGTGQPLANVAAGDFISVEFVGVNDPQDGTGHDIDPTKPPIEESRISIKDYVILTADITQGYFVVLLPYSLTYYICRNLSVTNYSIRNAAGITKIAPQTLILFALNMSGGICSLPTSLR